MSTAVNLIWRVLDEQLHVRAGRNRREGKAGEVAARAGERFHEAVSDRVGHMDHHGWNLGGDGPGGTDGRVPERHDEIDPGVRELSGRLTRRLLVGQVAKIELQGSSVLPSERFQAGLEGLEAGRSVVVSARTVRDSSRPSS